MDRQQKLNYDTFDKALMKLLPIKTYSLYGIQEL